jgi:hypothetical protein
MEREVRLRGDEITCVQKLAELFAKNVTCLNAGDEEANSLGLSPEKWEPVLGTMEHIGVITGVVHTSEGGFAFFHIDASVLQVARAIEEEETKKEEPRDIVAEIKQTAKSNRVIAYVIIAFGVLTILITFVNQLLSLLKELGLRH